MTTNQKQIWPFSIVPIEQLSAQQRKEVGFLQAAFNQGCCSYTFDAGNLGASKQNGKDCIIIRRGADRWEVILSELNKEAFSKVVTFDEAVNAALSWLG